MLIQVIYYGWNFLRQGEDFEQEMVCYQPGYPVCFIMQCIVGCVKWHYTVLSRPGICILAG